MPHARGAATQEIARPIAGIQAPDSAGAVESAIATTGNINEISTNTASPVQEQKPTTGEITRNEVSSEAGRTG